MSFTMDSHHLSIAPQLLALDIDEIKISSILPSLMSSLTGRPLVNETSIENLVLLERSGNADDLVNETRKVLSALNSQLHHQQVIYEHTFADILKEVKRQRITISNKVSIIDDLQSQVREYQRQKTVYEQTISNNNLQIRHYEEQLHQLRLEIEQKNFNIQNLETEVKTLQQFKIQFLAVDVEKTSYEIIRKTLLAENSNLRKWKTELEAKIFTLEQLKFQLSIDYVKLTETVLLNSKAPQTGGEELVLLKGRLIAEKENVALLQQHVEGLLSRSKDLETQIVELKQRNKRLTDELNIEVQRHEEATKIISELNQKIYEQSKTITVLSKPPDMPTTQKVTTSEDTAIKVLSEKFQDLQMNHGSTLKIVEELQKEVETVRADRDAAYATVDRYSVSLAEIRKLVIERISVSFNSSPVTIPSVLSPPVTPPKPRVPMSEIAEQAKRYHDLLNSPPSKKRKD